MAPVNQILITFPGGRRVDAQIRGRSIHTDQPREKGGEDTAPSPFDLFLAALGTCAGIFVQGFCAARNISLEGIRIVERPELDAEGTLRVVGLELQLPSSFPDKYRDAILKAIEGCTVKRAIAAQPVFKIAAVQSL